MVELKDGPCQGFFMVRRSPVYLRAVLDQSGEKDLLDQVDDVPYGTETVYVYKRQGLSGVVHLHAKGCSGWYAVATYIHMPEVDGQALRDNDAWQKWVIAQAEKDGVI